MIHGEHVEMQRDWFWMLSFVCLKSGLLRACLNIDGKDLVEWVHLIFKKKQEIKFLGKDPEYKWENWPLKGGNAFFCVREEKD